MAALRRSDSCPTRYDYSTAAKLVDSVLCKKPRPDPNVAKDLNNLAKHYDDQGRYSEAEPLYKRALTIEEKALGPDHPAVAQVTENLARTLRKLGRDTEAKAYEEQAAKIHSNRKP
jgi:tetratricopeptide (TPR) repeat protein